MVSIHHVLMSVLCLSWIQLVGVGVLAVLALPERSGCIGSTLPSTDLRSSPRGDSTPYGFAAAHESYDGPNLIRCLSFQTHEARAILPPPSSNVDSPLLDTTPSIMSPFSILPIISYTLLALALSYIAIRLARHFNIRLVPSFLTANPTPVTTKGKAKWWNWNFLRRSWKGRNAKVAGLNLQSVELLPTSAIHAHTLSSSTSLFDLPSSTSSTATLMGMDTPGVKMGVFPGSSNVRSATVGKMGPMEQQQQEAEKGDGRFLSRSSSLDTFPTFASPPRASSGMLYAPAPANGPFQLTPPLSAASTVTSFVASPRTPSPQFHVQHQHQQMVPAKANPSSNPFKFSFSLPGMMYPRSPSPSLSLSTSPAGRSHRRSHSLGGVPLRRLSASRMENIDRPGSPLSDAKGKGRQALLIDFSSSSGSESSEVSENPASSATSSDVGMQRVELGPGYSEGEEAGRYGPLVPVPVPLVDLGEEDQRVGPVGTAHVWAFDLDLEDGRRGEEGREAEKEEERLMDVGEGEEGRMEERLVDVEYGQVEIRREKLVDVDEEENTPLTTVRETLLSAGAHQEQAEKLVDVESSEPEVSFLPSSPLRVQEHEPKLVEISDDEHQDDLEAQESWNWDDDDQDDPWAQAEGGKSEDLIRFEEEREREVEEEQQALVPVDEESQGEAVIELVQELASEGLIPGLEAVVMLIPESDEMVEEGMDGMMMPEEELEGPEATEEEEIRLENDGVDADLTLVAPDLVISSKNLAHLERSPLISPVDDVLLEKPTALWLFGQVPTTGDIEGARDFIDTYTPIEKPPTILPETVPVVQRAEVPVEGIDIEEMLSPVSLKGQPLEPIPDELTCLELESNKTKYSTSSVAVEDIPITNMNDTYENYDNDTTQVSLPALELPPLSIPLITISSVVEEPEEEFPDPDLLPLPMLVINNEEVVEKEKESPKQPPSQTPTPPASPPLSPLRNIPSSPKKDRETKPAWSLRASDAPALGLSSANSSPNLRSRKVLFMEKLKEDTPDPTAVLSTSIPGSFPEPEAAMLAKAVEQTSPVFSTVPGATDTVATAVVAKPVLRHRTTRSPIDIALAMQLRPGLGVGADPAWMVRFLMTMFGWLAVLVSGRGEF